MVYLKNQFGWCVHLYLWALWVTTKREKTSASCVWSACCQYVWGEECDMEVLFNLIETVSSPIYAFICVALVLSHIFYLTHPSWSLVRNQISIIICLLSTIDSKNKPQQADRTSLATMLVLQLNIAGTRLYNVFIQQQCFLTYIELLFVFFAHAHTLRNTVIWICGRNFAALTVILVKAN